MDLTHHGLGGAAIDRPSAATAREKTNEHYDQAPEIFRLFLDPAMKYSSGLFLRDDDSLEKAQLQKMDFVAAQLGVKGGESILDVGCGWGALALHLADRYGCHVVGLTPSPKQASFIAARAADRGIADRVRIEVRGVEESRFPAGSFDGITLLGSIIHMPDKAAVLAECYRLLKHRGRIYLSESCFRNTATEREFAERPGTLFVRDSIFGWAELLCLSSYVRWMEDAGASCVSLTDLTDHYRRTIECWQENALSNREKLEAVEAGVVDKLVHYFDVSNAGWGFTTKHYAIVGSRSR